MSARLSVLVVGAALVCAGEFILGEVARLHAMGAWVAERGLDVFTPWLGGLIPRGDAAALVIVLLGGLLIAVALGLPRGSLAEPAAAPDADPRPLARWWAPILLLGTVALAVTCGVLLRGKQPGQLAIATWVGALVAGLVAGGVADRGRATRFGCPLRSGREAALVAGLVIAGLGLIAHDLTDWHWAGIPDESHFFMFARDVAIGKSERFPLSEEGVFGYHPVLSTYFQVAFMKVFGVGIFGWRLSSAVSLAVSLGFTYVFVREMWGPYAGVAAAVLFGSQPLAVAYGHFGYNNAQVYPVVMGSLAVGAWAFRKRSLAGLYTAGCIAGLGFATFYSARLAPLFLVWCGLSMGALSVRRGRRAELFALALGVVLAALPTVAHPEDTFGRMLRQTAVTGGHSMSPGEWWLALRDTVAAGAGTGRLWQHWLVSIVHPLWEKCPGQFQPRLLLDPISSGLVAVGFWMVLGGLRRDPGSRFLLPAYLLAALVNGAISQHDCPPLTRLLALAPFVGMFAAVAVARLAGYVDSAARRPAVAWSVTAAIACAAATLNIVALRGVVFQRNHGFGDGTTSELVRLVLQVPEECHLVYVQHVPTSMESVDFVMHQYGRAERFTHLRPSGAVIPEVPADLAPPLLIVHDFRNPEQARAVEGPVAERFPERQWQDSDPGKGWNLRYLYAPGSG